MTFATLTNHKNACVMKNLLIIICVNHMVDIKVFFLISQFQHSVYLTITLDFPIDCFQVGHFQYFLCHNLMLTQSGLKSTKGSKQNRASFIDFAVICERHKWLHIWKSKYDKASDCSSALRIALYVFTSWEWSNL